MNRAKTLKALGPLQFAYTKPLDKERQRLYVLMLADIPPEVLSVGVAYCIKHCKYMPTIAEIRESCSTALDIAADKQSMDSAEAWKLVQKAIASVGYMNMPHFDNPILQTVVDRIGWRDICQTPIEDTAILRAQFRKAYEAEAAHRQEIREFADAGVPVPQHVLQSAGLEQLADNLKLPGGNKHDFN